MISYLGVFIMVFGLIMGARVVNLEVNAGEFFMLNAISSLVFTFGLFVTSLGG